MITLSFFLVIVLFIYIDKQANNNRDIWKLISKYFLPILLIIVIFKYYFLTETNSFTSVFNKLGQILGSILLPISFSITLLFLLLKHKSVNNYKIKISIGIIFLIVVTFGIGIYLWGNEPNKAIATYEISNNDILLNESSNKERSIDVVKKSVDLFNEELPKDISDIGILETVFIDEEKSVVFVIKDNKTENDYTVEELQNVRSLLTEQFTLVARNSTNNQVFKETNTTIKYLIKDALNEPLFLITILPEDYK